MAGKYSRDAICVCAFGSLWRTAEAGEKLKLEGKVAVFSPLHFVGVFAPLIRRRAAAAFGARFFLGGNHATEREGEAHVCRRAR